MVELLIVVAILGLLSAIAVPNLLKSRQAARRGWFMGTARTIGSSLEIFQNNNRGLYPADGFRFSPPGNNLGKWYRDTGNAWNQNWRIDYEVHDSTVSGTKFIGLSFRGLLNAPFNSVAIRIPALRSQYGFGDTIPGTGELIFVFYENVPNNKICADGNCTAPAS